MSSVLSRQCHRLRESLPSYAEGRLGGPAQAEVEAHLAACPRCAAEVAELRVMLVALRAVPQEPLPTHLVAKVQRAVAARPAARPRLVWTRFVLPLAAGVGLFAIVAATRVADQLPSMPWMPKQNAGQTAELPRAQSGPALVAEKAALPRAAGVPGASGPAQLKAGADHQPPPVKSTPSPTQAEAGPAPPAPVRMSKVATANSTMAKPASTETPTPMAKAAPGAATAPRLFSQPAALEPATAEQPSMGGGGRAGGALPEANRAAGAGPGKPPSGLADSSASLRSGIGESATAKARMPRDGGAPESRGWRAPRRMGPNGRAAWRQKVGRGPAPGMSATGRGQARAKAEAPSATPRRAAASPGVILTQQGGGLAVALRLPSEGGERQVEVSSGGRTIYRGALADVGQIVLSTETKGSGPKLLPLRVASPTGAKDYTVFLPSYQRIGQPPTGAVVRRYREASLAHVLSDLSTRAGLIFFVEGPLERPVTAELRLDTPKAAVEALAAYLGYTAHTDDLVVYTLLPRP